MVFTGLGLRVKVLGLQGLQCWFVELLGYVPWGFRV